MTDTLLSTEIRDQPSVVDALLRNQRAVFEEVAGRARAEGIRWVLIAARGTSDNVARYAQHVLGRFCALPVALATPSLRTLYGVALRLERTLVIGISQSGQSPDVCAVLEDARAQGGMTLAITNDADSPLARVATSTIDICAGEERSVAATKTYTASIAAVAALAAELAGDPALRNQLGGVAEAMDEQIGRGVDAAVWLLDGVERCAVAGRGPNYATAHEAALKIKELTAIAAEPYSPADLMHGPLAVLGASTPLIALAVSGPALPSVLGAVREAGDRGSRCLLLADGELPRAGDQQIVPLVSVAEWLSPLVAILPIQGLAAQLARARGVDVDAPFGLHKVTRTR
jgi:glucosamine--fructose-6-phosphate aminotransferase (isomerizing)